MWVWQEEGRPSVALEDRVGAAVGGDERGWRGDSKALLVGGSLKGGENEPLNLYRWRESEASGAASDESFTVIYVVRWKAELRHRVVFTSHERRMQFKKLQSDSCDSLANRARESSLKHIFSTFPAFSPFNHNHVAKPIVSHPCDGYSAFTTAPCCRCIWQWRSRCDQRSTKPKPSEL